VAWIGFGFARLVLGGVVIPHSCGLVGHSDADVLLHAICDGLLGAASLGDIGCHFPDSDPEFKGISSLILLERTMRLIREKGWDLGNIDCTIVCQKPRLAPYIPRMIEEISRVTGARPETINVKATTTEHLGFAGREEGIAAYATVLLERKTCPGAR